MDVRDSGAITGILLAPFSFTVGSLWCYLSNKTYINVIELVLGNASDTSLVSDPNSQAPSAEARKTTFKNNIYISIMIPRNLENKGCIITEIRNLSFM